MVWSTDSDGYLVFLVPFFVVVGAAVLLIMRARRRVGYASSEKWPTTPARFRDGKVSVAGGRVGYYDTGTWYGVDATFDYAALGAIYHGKFHQGDFQDPEPADRLLARIKAGKMDVRYNPANPKDYFVDTDRDVRA